MRKLFSLLNCAMAAAIVVATIAAANILYLMFSNPDDVSVKKTGLWGAVFFESVENADGSLAVEAGLTSWTPLGVMWLAVTFVFFSIYLTYRGLKAYRNSLVTSSSDG